MAERNTDTKQAEIDVTRINISDAVKADYLQLEYLQQTLGILSQNEAVLGQLIQDATAHYQVRPGKSSAMTLPLFAVAVVVAGNSNPSACDSYGECKFQIACSRDRGLRIAQQSSVPLMRAAEIAEK